MIAWRWAASLTPAKGILLPGTVPAGSARKRLRLAWFQVRPEFFIASLASKPAALPALLPQMPASDGPMP